eukprot:29527-Eustigmatos_ZCMA.PRE.1
MVAGLDLVTSAHSLTEEALPVDEHAQTKPRRFDAWIEIKTQLWGCASSYSMSNEEEDSEQTQYLQLLLAFKWPG